MDTVTHPATPMNAVGTVVTAVPAHVLTLLLTAAGQRARVLTVKIPTPVKTLEIVQAAWACVEPLLLAMACHAPVIAVARPSEIVALILPRPVPI